MGTFVDFSILLTIGVLSFATSSPEAWPQEGTGRAEDGEESATINAGINKLLSEIRPSDDSEYRSGEADVDSGHSPGGLPMISESAFSLVTLMYVSIAFLFVFFMFCWKNGSESGPEEKLATSCPLMTSEMEGGVASMNDVSTAFLDGRTEGGEAGKSKLRVEKRHRPWEASHPSTLPRVAEVEEPDRPAVALSELTGGFQNIEG